MTAYATAAPLLDRLARLRERVGLLVERRSADDPTADDPLRGLYLSEAAVRHLLWPAGSIASEGFGLSEGVSESVPEGVFESVPEEEDEPPGGDRLRRLALRLALTALDVQVLLAALAPDLDRDFEPLYGYLNDDVSRRRATVGLTLELCGLPGHSTEGRARFHPKAPLSTLGLIVVEEPERPFLSRSLRVPDRVAAHLLGDDTLDAALTGYVRPLPAELPGPDPGPAIGPAIGPTTGPLTEKLAKHLATGPLTAYLRERRDGDGLVCAEAALRAAGWEALHLSARGGGHDPVPELLREARLRDCAIVVSPLPEQPDSLIRALAVPDVPVLLAGSPPYDPGWCDCDLLVLDAPRLPSDGAALSTVRLRSAARRHSASGLERHARRIRPAVGWADLVLPETPLAQLHELALRARNRHRVLGEWRLSAGGGRGRGTLALFAGESGTGKTLSAEVVAAELGLDLYVVQLSSVVDKYIGETEKNLERIFSEADRTDAVLLFDEADAVFGKRSEVKDSHDRYANLESAYLLQRLESFDGIAVLTTNLRANIDEAFTRRLDLVVDFPFPDAGRRLALWRHCLTHVPCADDIDPHPCARDFELTGGAIRSAVVTAAYAAAGRGEPATTADLLEGARREYRKAGRLVPGEGDW
ncbi:MAG: ATP-binding protein [Streptomycetaceae bacterium]|nr:ATP-binding protein [Streptomycetaceae bacterium]